MIRRKLNNTFAHAYSIAHKDSMRSVETKKEKKMPQLPGSIGSPPSPHEIT